MQPGTTLTERAKFVNPFVHKLLCEGGTFSKFLIKQFPFTEGYRSFEPPLHNDENYIVVIGPSDLVSCGPNSPKIKKPVQTPIQDMVINLNPTTQAMFVFQSQDYQKNIYRKIMGGIIASVVDNVTSMVMMASEQIPIPSVTIYLNCEYYDSIDVGERCFILCELKKVSQMSQNLRGKLESYKASSAVQQLSSFDQFNLTAGEAKIGFAFRGNDNDIEVCEARIFNEQGKLCYYGNHAKMYPRGSSSDQNTIGEQITRQIGDWNFPKELYDASRPIQSASLFPDQELALRISEIKKRMSVTLANPKL